MREGSEYAVVYLIKKKRGGEGSMQMKIYLSDIQFKNIFSSFS